MVPLVTDMKNAIAMVRLNLRQVKRSDEFNLKLMVIGVLPFLVLLAAIFGFIYYVYLTNYFDAPEPLISPKDPFAYLHLIIFSIMFYYGGVQTIFGLFNPFLMNTRTTELLLRLPANKRILHLSTMIQSSMKTIIVSLYYALIFTPVLVIGKFPWYHYILNFIVLFLSICQIVILLYLLYFLSRPLRHRAPSINFLNDTSSPLAGVVVLTPLILSQLFLYEDLYPRYDMLVKYNYMPIINSVVTYVGLFFRAGIPNEFYTSLLSLIISIIMGMILLAYLASNYPLHTELLDTLSRFNQNNAQRNQMQGTSPKTFELLSDVMPTTFGRKSKSFSIIYKDWLLLRRTRQGDKLIYWSILSVPIMWGIVLATTNPQVIFIIAACGIFLITKLLEVLFNSEQQFLLDRGYITRVEVVKAKFILFLLINTFIFSPFFMLNYVVVLITVLVTSAIYAQYYDAKILRSLQGQIVIVIPYIIMIGIILQGNVPQ